MEDNNVHVTSPNEREDLQHTDTVIGGSIDGGSGVGTDEVASIGDQLGHDPSNLGNDIPEMGDMTHPSPVNEPLGKMPGA